MKKFYAIKFSGNSPSEQGIWAFYAANDVQEATVTFRREFGDAYTIDQIDEDIEASDLFKPDNDQSQSDIREAFATYWQDASDGCVDSDANMQEMLRAWSFDAFVAGAKSVASSRTDITADLGKAYVAARNGNWMDEHGACRVCGGEIPYGHVSYCDIFKLEQAAK